MQELTSLIAEHRVIAQLVHGLAQYADRMRCEAYVDRADLARFARVFQEFADEIHHEKEENILLPALARAGTAWEHGVLAEVRREHRQERYLIEVLCHASTHSESWSKEDRRSIAATALELVDFQRRHLHKENEELFPEVLQRLDAAARRKLEADLRHFDTMPHHQLKIEELRALAGELAARYAHVAVESAVPLS